MDVSCTPSALKPFIKPYLGPADSASAIIYQRFAPFKRAFLLLLNPLAPPGRRLEGVREILGLVHDLSVAELHDTHCVCWSPLVRDGVFRDPEITISENSPDV